MRGGFPLSLNARRVMQLFVVRLCYTGEAHSDSAKKADLIDPIDPSPIDHIDPIDPIDPNPIDPILTLFTLLILYCSYLSFWSYIDPMTRSNDPINPKLIL